MKIKNKYSRKYESGWIIHMNYELQDKIQNSSVFDKYDKFIVLYSN